jgi:hypothetical protein
MRSFLRDQAAQNACVVPNFYGDFTVPAKHDTQVSMRDIPGVLVPSYIEIDFQFSY